MANPDFKAPVPAELESALRADPEALANFQTMPLSQQRRYGKWIDEAKKPETRAKRTAKSIELIKKW